MTRARGEKARVLAAVGAMTNTARERFVTLEEVADFLQKPRSWVYNRSESLHIPRYRVGNQWRYRLSEVAAWVEEKRAA